MAGPKTQPNDADVDAFLESVENERRRRDAVAVRDMMTRISGTEPRMWGSSIVGFGEYRYTNGSGKQASWMKIGFSPRKQALTLYIMDGFDSYDSLLDELGPHSTGRACLYLKDLDKIDQDVLEALIAASFRHVTESDESEGS